MTDNQTDTKQALRDLLNEAISVASTKLEHNHATEACGLIGAIDVLAIALCRLENSGAGERLETACAQLSAAVDSIALSLSRLDNPGAAIPCQADTEPAQGGEKEEAKVKTIELWNMGEFLAIIIPASTGIVWTNQTAGLACMHPETEGYLVPVNARIFNNTLENWGPWGGIENKYNVEQVQAFLAANDLASDFEPWPESDQPLHEAWVPVRIKADAERVELRGVRGECGVLTYPNSD